MNALKKWALDLLLSRGVSAAQEYLGKAVRNGVVAAGAALTAHGVAVTPDMTTTVTGAGMIIGGLALDFARTWLANYAAKQGTNMVGNVQTAHAPPATPPQ